MRSAAGLLKSWVEPAHTATTEGPSPAIVDMIRPHEKHFLRHSVSHQGPAAAHPFAQTPGSAGLGQVGQVGEGHAGCDAKVNQVTFRGDCREH